MTLVTNIFAHNTEQVHQCDEKGAVLILDDHSSVRDTPENRKKYAERERGWSVACSLCDRSQFHMDVYG